MGATLRIESGGSFTNASQSIDCDRKPCPTILATGISSASIEGHWIEPNGNPPMPPDSRKPPYRVPLVSEVAAAPRNGLTVASTFSGGGGSCFGYRIAGYSVLWANEFVPIAQQSYKANHPDSILDQRDIKKVTAADVLKATGLTEGQLDIFDGSPPCQAFSTAGKRERGWGKNKRYEHGAEQKNEELFFDYVRLLKGLQPRAFVAENVSGLVKGTAKGYFLEILAALKGCGYVVEAKLLDAQWLGVPQSRQRLIFVGVRADLVKKYGVRPAFPKPLPYRYTVRDALPWIVSADRDTSGQFSTGRFEDRPSPAITIGVNSINSGHYKVIGAIPPDGFPLDGPGLNPTPQQSGLTGRLVHGLEPYPLPPLFDNDTDVSRYAIGRESARLKPGEKSSKYFNLIRTDADKPAPTIMSSSGPSRSAAQPLHPVERRKFTIAEVKRICSFPDDYVLVGTYAQQWERLGNSVPPVMMSYIAAALRDNVFARMA